MKFPRLHIPRVLGFSAALLGWPAIGLTAFALSSCHQAPAHNGVAPAVEASGSTSAMAGAAPSAPPAGRPVPAVAAPAAPLPPTPEQIQIAEDISDNASAHTLAEQFVTHPDQLARQSAICGPANFNMTQRYMTRKGPPSDELRAFGVACIAKDIAQDETRQQAARAGGGVQNTRSL